MAEDAVRIVGPELSPLVRFAELTARLKAIVPGRSQWPQYQKTCEEMLKYLVCPPLATPLSQSSNRPRVNQRDYILPNYATDDFWRFLAQRYLADYVVIDAKNLRGRAAKDQILQIANYLSRNGTGLVGIVITRRGETSTAYYTRREQWILYDKLILVLDDRDIFEMLELRNSGSEPSVLLRQVIEDFHPGI